VAIFRGGKRLGPFDIRLGLPRGREYDNIPGDPRIKQRANPETTINRFRSAIAKGEGVARNTRFLVNIQLPKGGALKEAISPLFFGADEAGQEVSGATGQKLGDTLSYEKDLAPTVALMCTNITMPGRTINTSPYRIAGAPYKYPTQVQYTDINATFIGDKFLRLRTFFEAWQNIIYNNQTGMFNFYDEYVSPIDIFQLGQFDSLNDRDSATYGIRLRECFPTAINQIQYDAGAQNQFVAIEVTFAYRDWLNFNLDIDSTGKVGGLSSGEVKAGGGIFSSLPPELRRTGRGVLNQLKRSIPIGRVFGGKIFPPFTF
jgi:hypothetical protein|tara:strand:- start:6198 stop:7145 length:948 start_codon:yes stop_codon:yes gene_type:complete